MENTGNFHAPCIFHSVTLHSHVIECLWAVGISSAHDDTPTVTRLEDTFVSAVKGNFC